MKIQYCSDLHLEFWENKAFLRKHPIVPIADILVLAGDIIPFVLMEKCKNFFDLVSDQFKLVYWVPGNHEYYQADINQRTGVLHEQIRENVFLVNNIAIQQGDIRLVFSTLWSKISPVNELQIEQRLSDFKLISNNGLRFNAQDFNQLHADSLAFMENELNNKKEGRTVVVTHHVPTFFQYPEKFRGSLISEGFATELFPMWIIGSMAIIIVMCRNSVLAIPC
jgi:predicted MPP superfamily phosphohydrolase